MNINELIERAHSQAKAIGWWDKERNVGELLMLIVSECGEALEAHRSGKRANMALFEQEESSEQIRKSQIYNHAVDPEIPLSSPFEYAFRTNIKDTFEDELADIVLRIADLCGHLQIEMDPEPKPWTMEYFQPKNIGELLLLVTSSIVDHYRLNRDKEKINANSLRQAMGLPFLIAQLEGIDIWRHIELKMKYNLTRGHKHGKAY